MSNEIRIRRGDTLSYTARIPLPAGNWSATCSFRHKGACYQIPATMSLIGVNADDPNKNDWSLQLLASATETSAWPHSVEEWGLKVQAAIRFSDDSPTPIVRTSDSFPVVILPSAC